MLMPSSHNRRRWGYHPDSGGFGARPLLAGVSVDWMPRGTRNWSIHNSTNANADQVQLERHGQVMWAELEAEQQTPFGGY